MYTLGGLLVSVDDDMRPYALVEDSPESLGDDEIARGKLYKKNARGFTRKSFDLLAAFVDVLGKRVSDLPPNFVHGKLVRDTAMDLHTNASCGLQRANSLVLETGALAADALVKVAQTFRSGTSDADALDFVEMALDDEAQSLEIWPTLVEIVYLQKRRHGLPITRVDNPRRQHHAKAFAPLHPAGL